MSVLKSELMQVKTADSTAITTATETLLTHTALFPANYMRPGRILKAVLAGKASNAVTTPGTLTLRVRWNGLAGTILAASTALTQNVIAQTDDTWIWTQYILCRVGGSGGTLLSYGNILRGNRAAAVVADIPPDMIPATGLADVSIDLTAAGGISFTAQSSVTTASFTCMSAHIESIGSEFANINGGGEFTRIAAL